MTVDHNDRRQRVIRSAIAASAIALGMWCAPADASIPRATRSTDMLEQRVPKRTGDTASTMGDRVPILMYHRIGEAEDRFTIRPSRLRAHIDTLCASGYELQTFGAYARGEPTRSGAPAAVLTFDDSTEGQFRLLPGGRVDPESAVGVLDAARHAHPSCGVSATFFVNAVTERGLPAFEQPGLEGRKLTYLQRHGYEVGAHGFTHRDFARLTPVQASADARALRAWVHEVAPTVRMSSFAYPYGSIPGAQVRVAVDAVYASSAHAWGGVARVGQSRLVPRIETGAKTVLASYAPRVTRVPIVDTQLAIAQPEPHLSRAGTVPPLVAQVVAPAVPSRVPAVRLAEPFTYPHGNAYKWKAVHATYARHDPQLPPQPARLLWRPDDRRGGWHGEPRASVEAHREEGHLLDGQEADRRRGALRARELWGVARPVRDRDAWPSVGLPGPDPVGVLAPYRRPQPMLYAPAVALGLLGDEQSPTPRAMPAHVPSPLAPCAWYDQEITHGPVSRALKERSRASRRAQWWPF